MVGFDGAEEFDEVDAALVDGYQRDFPVEPAPFEVIGAELGFDGEEVYTRIEHFRDVGLVRRIGPVLDPQVIGSSTLLAAQVPPDRFESVIPAINNYPQITHNYRRDGDWNLWMVLTAATSAARERIRDEIATLLETRVLDLPRKTDYCTSLVWPVFADPFDQPASTVSPTAPPSAETALEPFEAELLLAIQSGFPATRSPFQDLAQDLEVDVSRVTEAINDLRDRGYIKRVGIVVNHRVSGFDHNCLVVWAVPPADVDEIGAVVGGLPYVTKCYHRPQRPAAGWPYTLFTMLHARSADALEERITELATDHIPYDYERLDTLEQFKHTGARYETLLTDSLQS